MSNLIEHQHQITLLIVCANESHKTHPILLAAPEAATAIRVLNDAIYEFKKEFFTTFWTKFAFKQTQVRSEKECQPPLALSPLSLSSCLVAA